MSSTNNPGSFCVPHTAIQALLDARATALEICAYLTLARFTDSDGCYSTASVNAIYKATGSNKMKGGTIERAIARLKTIRAIDHGIGLDGPTKPPGAKNKKPRDLGPILFCRSDWVDATGEVLEDGPSERGAIRHVLPDFDETISRRVWFGNNLVTGVGEFKQPLRMLKNAGDVAARLLLALYAANDMETWGGVPPGGGMPWLHFAQVGEDVRIPGGRLLRAKSMGQVASIDPRISSSADEYWNALRALEAAGLIYRVTLAVNRTALHAKFANGGAYCNVPVGSEPLFELDTHSIHGFKPKGEEGLGGAMAKTSGELGYSVAREDGRFDDTYAALVPDGFPAMIAGIYRMRLRVSNPRNSGVRGSWARIHQSNRDAFDTLNRIRRKNGLEQMAAPWEQAEPKQSCG